MGGYGAARSSQQAEIASSENRRARPFLHQERRYGASNEDGDGEDGSDDVFVSKEGQRFDDVWDEEEEEEEEDGSLYVSGFWPDRREFRDLLLEEARWRVNIVGEWSAPLVRAESKVTHTHIHTHTHTHTHTVH